MKRVMIGMVLVLSVAPVAHADTTGSSINLSATALGTKLSGHTLYHLNASGYFPGVGNVRVDSELEFPLEFYLAGVGLELAGRLPSGLPWSVGGSIHTSLSDPSGYVKDSDWLTATLYGFTEQFSYTDSDAKGSAFLLDLAAKMGVYHHPKASVSGMAGLKYQKFDYDVLGVKGWQLDSLGNKFYFEAYKDELVGTYEVSYKMPYFGLTFWSLLGSKLELDAKGAFAPRVFATDLDDHVLRNKTGEGDCSGTGYWFGGSLSWPIISSDNVPVLVIGSGVEYSKISTDGDQTQTWYGDDPITSDEDEKGMVISGINYEMESEQLAITLLVSWLF